MGMLTASRDLNYTEVLCWNIGPRFEHTKLVRDAVLHLIYHLGRQPICLETRLHTRAKSLSRAGTIRCQKEGHGKVQIAQDGGESRYLLDTRVRLDLVRIMWWSTGGR